MRWNTIVINNKIIDLYLLVVEDVDKLFIENIRFQSSRYVTLLFKKYMCVNTCTGRYLEFHAPRY